MPDNRDCPFCAEEVGADDIICKHCGYEIDAVNGARPVKAGDEIDWLPGKVEEKELLSDEFSELDYEPKKKIGCLLPLAVIILVIVMVIVGVMVLRDGDNGQKIDDLQEEPAEELSQDQETDLETELTEPEPGEAIIDQPEEELSDQNGEPDSLPVDLTQLEATLEKWLRDRVDNQDTILLPSSELDDIDRFFESYDLDEGDIIVYQIESAGEEFATVKFGLPYSEWSIRAVFIWRNGKWDFLREEEIR